MGKSIGTEGRGVVVGGCGRDGRDQGGTALGGLRKCSHTVTVLHDSVNTPHNTPLSMSLMRVLSPRAPVQKIPSPESSLTDNADPGQAQLLILTLQIL